MQSSQAVSYAQAKSYCAARKAILPAIRTSDDLTHFKVAGQDRKFVDATAKIVDGKVVVSAEGVKKPSAVRFAWHETAVGNLSNAEGLPAVPFRTDDW